MRTRRIFLLLLIFLVGASVPRVCLGGIQYAEITADRVNIRTGPATSSRIVAKARRGDMFELHGREGNWYRIKMFSPDWRYVHRSLVQRAQYVHAVPNLVSLRRDIFQALVRAQNRADVKADETCPVQDKHGKPLSENVRKNLALTWLLSDRYQLHVMHRFAVQPPIYDSIMHEGIKKGW